jgi:hypothetical protein
MHEPPKDSALNCCVGIAAANSRALALEFSGKFVKLWPRSAALNRTRAERPAARGQFRKPV